MVRPRKFKKINFEPDVTYFKPRAVPLTELEEVDLTLDELETLRLSNIEKLSQENAALKMEVHQSTFQRTLTRAREKITDALVNGKAIKIYGGEYKMPNISESCSAKTGKGRMGNSLSPGPGGKCVCTECGFEEPHQRGVPCSSKNCPNCKISLIRG